MLLLVLGKEKRGLNEIVSQVVSGIVTYDDFKVSSIKNYTEEIAFF